ncbi:MarR family winged helix-turn-helix transcriptional regulator [Aeromicrobium massiliense]|uniref:MarR family winged helix-turn-helix transcriptional regulator n=1 Tax=Aeromicrobium massiliense TaxID=1464554 RepID=UPI0002F1946C|nr:MarR family transcriptional regulator [Aeromicrobium massiliense]
MNQLELASALRTFAVDVARSTRSTSMSRVAAATLGVLERSGGRRITALADQEGVSQPAMTGLVQRLEASGLVRREDDPADGRVSLISITDAGREALRTRRAEQDAAMGAWLDRLSPAERDLLAAAAPVLLTYPDTEDHAHR